MMIRYILMVEAAATRRRSWQGSTLTMNGFAAYVPPRDSESIVGHPEVGRPFRGLLLATRPAFIDWRVSRRRAL
jgi:hypothetical protein